MRADPTDPPARPGRRRHTPFVPVRRRRGRPARPVMDVSGDAYYGAIHSLIVTGAPYLGGVLTGRGIEFDD